MFNLDNQKQKQFLNRKVYEMSEVPTAVTNPAAADPAAPDGGAPTTVEQLQADATHWLEVVEDANMPPTQEAAENPSEFQVGRNQVIGYLKEEVAHGDGQVMLLLAEMEQAAQRSIAESGRDDAVEQRQARNSRFNLLANAMLGFRGQAEAPGAPEAAPLGPDVPAGPAPEATPQQPVQ